MGSLRVYASLFWFIAAALVLCYVIGRVQYGLKSYGALAILAELTRFFINLIVTKAVRSFSAASRRTRYRPASAAVDAGPH
jgi:hypothetical protein